MYSVLWNNIPAAIVLMKNGADLNIRNSDGKTALEFAEKEGRIDMASAIRYARKGFFTPRLLARNRRRRLRNS